jgi:hypothetical protein
MSKKNEILEEYNFSKGKRSLVNLGDDLLGRFGGRS